MVHPRYKELRIPYPKNMTDEEEKKEFKDEHLRENPDSLRADFTRGREKLTNYIFYTNRRAVWRKVLGQTKPFEDFDVNTKDRGMIQLSLKTKPSLNINLYDSGTVMVQGTDIKMEKFYEAFAGLRVQVTDQDSPAQDSPAEDAPDQEATDEEAPDQEAPDQEAPDQEAPDQEARDQQAPDQQAPDQEAPDQEARDQEAPAQEAPDEEAPAQEATDLAESVSRLQLRE